MFQTNPFGQIVDVLGRQSNQDAARTRRYNPRPPGVLQPGGAPLAVLAFLKANPDRYFSFYQIVLATGRTEKSLDFACRQLRDMDLIVTRTDPGNPRYFQYKFRQDGGQL